MFKFCVEVTETTVKKVWVEAEDEREAIDKAIDDPLERDLDECSKEGRIFAKCVVPLSLKE